MKEKRLKNSIAMLYTSFKWLHRSTKYGALWAYSAAQPATPRAKNKKERGVASGVQRPQLSCSRVPSETYAHCQRHGHKIL